MATKKVTVTIGGIEVAKWWRRVLGDKHGMDWDKSSAFFPVGGSFPIYRDVPTEAGTSAWSGEPYPDVPYLGEDTYVELRVNLKERASQLDMAQLATKVISQLQQEDVPIAQCNRLQIQIEEAG